MGPASPPAPHRHSNPGSPRARRWQNGKCFLFGPPPRFQLQLTGQRAAGGHRDCGTAAAASGDVRNGPGTEATAVQADQVAHGAPTAAVDKNRESTASLLSAAVLAFRNFGAAAAAPPPLAPDPPPAAPAPQPAGPASPSFSSASPLLESAPPPAVPAPLALAPAPPPAALALPRAARSLPRAATSSTCGATLSTRAVTPTRAATYPPSASTFVRPAMFPPPPTPPSCAASSPPHQERSFSYSVASYSASMAGCQAGSRAWSAPAATARPASAAGACPCGSAMRRANRDISLPAEQMHVLSACILRVVPLFLLFLLLLARRSEMSCSACVETSALERCRVPVCVLCRTLTRVLSIPAQRWPLLPRAAPSLPRAAPLLPRAAPLLPLFSFRSNCQPFGTSESGPHSRMGRPWLLLALRPSHLRPRRRVHASAWATAWFRLRWISLQTN